MNLAFWYWSFQALFHREASTFGAKVVSVRVVTIDALAKAKKVSKKDEEEYFLALHGWNVVRSKLKEFTDVPCSNLCRKCQVLFVFCQCFIIFFYFLCFLVKIIVQSLYIKTSSICIILLNNNTMLVIFCLNYFSQ